MVRSRSLWRLPGAAAQNGIKSVRKHAQADKYFDRRNAEDASPYFALVAANKEILGTSEMYASATGRETGIASVKANAGVRGGGQIMSNRLLLVTATLAAGLACAPLSAAQEAGVTPAQCPPGITSIADCPAAGCGDVSDGFLNQSKNRVEVPAPGDIIDMSLAEIKLKPQPADWTTGKDRQALRQAGEGSAVRVMGFLKAVKAEGRESCNCELGKRPDTDLHLVVVEKKNDSEKTSVTVEVTPRVRRTHHPSWTFQQTKQLSGSFVRVTGWLLLDTGHVPHSVLLPGEHGRQPLKRATNWEIHPLTRIERCTAPAAKCRDGLGWVEF